MREVKVSINRGDIYYIKGIPISGSEQSGNRPGIIVSNEKCNMFSRVVEVVYLTTKDKKPLPTHVPIAARKPSIALCEQVHSVNVSRLSVFMNHITESEMKAIDRALMISLALEREGQEQLNKVIKIGDQDVAVIEWKGERVITTAQLANVYETDANNVQVNYGRNHEKFKEKKHYFYITGQELKDYKRLLTESQHPISDDVKYTSQLYLWTRRGASRHCKILDTEKAWEQFDQMEEYYFNSSKNNIPSGKELLALAVLEAQKTIEEQNNQIQRMRPKEIFADAVCTSKSSILIGELAKILKQNGIDIGQNRLFEWMRNNEYLIKRKGTDYNMPRQKSMELGLFEIKETCITHADGHTSVSKTTKVTGKGQQYFINKFVDDNREVS